MFRKTKTFIDPEVFEDAYYEISSLCSDATGALEEVKYGNDTTRRREAEAYERGLREAFAIFQKMYSHHN